MIYDLTHPAVFDHFAFSVILVAFVVAAVVAGIGATVQHERSRHRPASTTERRHAPRALLVFLGGLTGLSLGALLVASMAAGRRRLRWCWTVAPMPVTTAATRNATRITEKAKWSNTAGWARS